MSRKRSVAWTLAAAMVASSGLSGCAGYHPDPLVDRPDLAAGLDGIAVDQAAMPLPELRSHAVDPSRPLDMDAVAMLAVSRNPDLRTARVRAHVTHAEAFNAGLLPNPTFSADYGVVSSGPGTVGAFTLALMQDIMPFVTLSSRRDAGRALVRGAELDLLWQEWQVVSQARLLTVRAVSLAKQRALLDSNRNLFRERSSATRAALLRGDETLVNVVSDLAALTSIETQLHDLDQQTLSNQFDLDALLGLEPGTELSLADSIDLPDPDSDKIRAALPDLVGRRPDLLALKAGYEAQEEAVYQAVLNQFPPLSLGGNRASDNTNVKSWTGSISIALPVFNHNEGAIAVEKANRETLKADYQARLDAAYAGVRQTLSEIALLRAQYESCADSLTVLDGAGRQSEAAFRGGGLDERSFADLKAAELARRLEATRIEEALLEQKVTLRTLVGSVVPDTLKKDDQP
ncbi:MAG TPA: TolC family protein [Magnetospirillaceae bacterium]|nr:TolC family protein [Magnetospirillaceae bacterium]